MKSRSALRGSRRAERHLLQPNDLPGVQPFCPVAAFKALRRAAQPRFALAAADGVEIVSLGGKRQHHALVRLLFQTVLRRKHAGRDAAGVRDLAERLPLFHTVKADVSQPKLHTLILCVRHIKQSPV